jgi:NADPH:quinone reductase
LRLQNASRAAFLLSHLYTGARERPHRGGHYAEFVVAPVEATYLLPDGVDFDAAATLANYQVAYHMFNHAVRPQEGQRLLVYAAAAGMGNALIDLAKIAGLIVIGVVSDEEKSRLAEFSSSTVRSAGKRNVICGRRYA